MIIDLCRKFKQSHQDRIEQARVDYKNQAVAIHKLAVSGLLLAVGLGGFLGYTLIRQVLGPLHQLATGSDAVAVPGTAVGDVRAVSERIQELLSDIQQTKSKLEWSRRHLQQSEKWALVGKLAAGVAHSIRNPLTSVKMRLFSMERTVQTDTNLREDIEVISEEIRHIETVVTHFLEFSRPPKLKMRPSSLSDVVDTAVQLLSHRLESLSVSLTVDRTDRLPLIMADPDQLKEVLVNLIVNACEAMTQGGSIRIEEQKTAAEGLGTAMVLKVIDTGPGVPEAVQAKIFQPFFSTKEEGTGLGLSIATRIVEEHGGWLDLISREGEGSTFIITLPAGEEKNWAESS